MHMRWAALGVLGKATVIALFGMAGAHVWATLARDGELPTFAIVFELILVGLAVRAATGRWFLIGTAAVLSGAIGVMSAFGAIDASPPLSGGALIAVLVFCSLQPWRSSQGCARRCGATAPVAMNLHSTGSSVRLSGG